jgi:uncharacterized membrane protein
LDFIRGFCILLVIMDHTFFDLAFLFFRQWFPDGQGSGLLFWFSDLLRTGYFPWIVRDVIWGLAVFSFVFVSGISCSFSHSNLKRGLRLAAVAIALTLITLTVDRLMGKQDSYTIRFGILHMLSASILLYCGVRRFGPIPMIALGILAVAVGLFYSQQPLETSFQPLAILVHSTSGFRSADYFPLLPWFGYFLIGGALGPKLYSKRSTRFPAIGSHPWMRPIQFAGRHSLIVYVIHQPIVYGTLSVIGLIITVNS